MYENCKYGFVAFLDILDKMAECIEEAVLFLFFFGSKQNNLLTFFTSSLEMAQIGFTCNIT